MSYGTPFPSYPRTTVWEKELEAELETELAELKAKKDRQLAKVEQKYQESLALMERGERVPSPPEVESLRERFAWLETEANALQAIRMFNLYPAGYEDVGLIEAWARLAPEVAQRLTSEMEKESEYRTEHNALNSYLIYAEDPRHKLDALSGYLRLITEFPDILGEEVVPEVAPVPIDIEPSPEYLAEKKEKFPYLWETGEEHKRTPGKYQVETDGEPKEVELKDDMTVWEGDELLGTYDPQTGQILAPETEPAVIPEGEEKWWTKLGREIWQEIPLNPYFWKSPAEQAEIEGRRIYLEFAKAEGIENPEEWVEQLYAEPQEPVCIRAYTDEPGEIRLPTTPIALEGYVHPISPQERLLGEWLIPIVAISWIPGFGAVQGWLLRHGGKLGQMVAKTLSPLVWMEKAPAQAITAVARRVFKPKFPELIEPQAYVAALKVTHPERFKTKADADAIFREIKQYNLYIREVAQNAPPPLMANLTSQGASQNLFKLKPIKGGLYDMTVTAPYIKPKVKGASMALADIIQNPSAYNWLGKQGKLTLRWVRAYHEVEAALLNFEKKSGILIKERWYPAGEYHVGRNVVAEVDNRGNVLLERALSRGRLGTKLSAERERAYLTQAEGVKAGKIYALPEESLTFRIQSAYDRAGGLKVKAQYLETLSATPKELLDTNIKQQREVLSRNYRDALYIRQALLRVKRGETLPPATLAAIVRRSPQLTTIPKGKELTQLIKTTNASIDAAKAELRNFAPIYHRATARAREAAFTEGRIWAFPAIQNRIFTDIVNPHNPNEVLMTGKQVVTRLNEIFGAQRVNAAWATASDVSRVGVSLVAAMDGSWPFIQGPMVLGRDAANWAVGKPSAMWAKSTFEMLKTMINPRYASGFLKRHAATFAEAPLLIQAPSEFVWGYGVLSRWASKVPLVGGALTKIINETYGRMGAGFSGAAVASRTLLYENLKKSWLKHGGDLTELQLLCNQISGAISLRYLGVSPQEAARESALIFAPSFTRAWLMNLRDLFRGTLKAREVQKAMAGMFASMFTAYIGVSAALGQKPKLNPAPISVGGDGAQFLSVEVGGVNVGAPGWGYSLLRVAANVAAAAATNPEALIKLDMANPTLRWMMSKTSPLVNLAKETALQRDYFGNRLEDPEDWVVMLADKVIPIAAQSILEKEPGSNVWVAVGAELFGVRTYPVQPYERLARMEADLAEKYIDREGDPYLWDDLPNAFKDEIRRANPEFTELEEQITEEWAMRRATDEERNVYIIKKEVEEKFEADMDSLVHKLRAGEITPQEYARFIQDIRGTRATQRDLLWRLREIGDPESVDDYERYMIEEAPPEDRYMHTYWDYWARLIEAEGTVIDWGKVNQAVDTWLDTIDPYYKDYILKYKNDWILDLPEPVRGVELARQEDTDRIKESGYWDINPEAKTEDKVVGGVFVKGGKNLRVQAREKDANLDAALILWYSPEAIRHEDTLKILRERLTTLGIPEMVFPGLYKYEARTRMEVGKALADAIQADPSLAEAIKTGTLTESQRSKLLKIYLEVYGQPRVGAFEEWIRTELPKY